MCLEKNIFIFLLFLLASCESSAPDIQQLHLDAPLIVGEARQFDSIFSVVVDADSNIYLSNPKGFEVVKLDMKGEVVARIGRRGEGPGEFTKGPRQMDLRGDSLIVVDGEAVRGLTIVNTSMKYVDKFRFPEGVYPYDAMFDHDGNFLTAGGSLDPTPLTFSHSGRLEHRFNIDRNPKEGLYNYTRVRRGLSNDYVIIHLFKNIIEVYDPTKGVTLEFSIEGLPLEAESGATALTLPTATESEGDLLPKRLPIKAIMSDAAVDRDGNIYVLVKDYAENPLRDVMIFDRQGQTLAKLTLQNPTNLIYIKHHQLYATQDEGTSLVRYSLPNID